MTDLEDYKTQKRIISYMQSAMNHPWYTPWIKDGSVIHELTCPNGHVAFKTKPAGWVRCPICGYHGPPGPPVAIRVKAVAVNDDKIIEDWHKRQEEGIDTKD